MPRVFTIGLPALLLAGGCLRPVRPAQPTATKRPPDKATARLAGKLPGWYGKPALARALADAAGPELTGIWSLALHYAQGEDHLLYYLDLQARQGVLETVALRETAPLPASPFISADWRGKWVVVQPGKAHPRWPVDALRDLSTVWPLLAAPRTLATLAGLEGRAAPWKDGSVLVEYEGGRQVLLRNGQGVVVLVDGGARYEFARRGEQLVVRRADATVELRGRSIERIAFHPAGLPRATAEIRGWRPAGTPAREQDRYREAMLAYRQARRKGAGAQEAARRVVALFGGWAAREIGGVR